MSSSGIVSWQSLFDGVVSLFEFPNHNDIEVSTVNYVISKAQFRINRFSAIFTLGVCLLCISKIRLQFPTKLAFTGKSI